MRHDRYRQMHCDVNRRHDSDGQLRSSKDHADGHGDTGDLYHLNRASVDGDDCREWRHREPDAHRLGNADQRNLFFGGDNTQQRQRADRCSHGCAGRWIRCVAGQLHTRCSQFLHLWHSNRHIVRGISCPVERGNSEPGCCRPGCDQPATRNESGRMVRRHQQHQRPRNRLRLPDCGHQGGALAGRFMV